MEQTTLYDVSRAPRPRRKTTRRFSTTPDEALLRATREGDREAYGELFRRHSKAALVAARSFRDLAEPDDVVAEAFANIFETLAKGSGPTGAFRPYLYVTIRNLAHRQLRTAGHEVDLDPEIVAVDSAVDPAQAALETSLTTTAFRSLPERWQTVLWYTEVERMTPRQAGELMGIGANAVSALSFRARAALREAWVQGHVNDAAATGTHRAVLARLAGWSLGTLSQRDEAMVNEHLKTCTRCRLVAEELEDVSKRLAIILLPLILGGTAALVFQRQIAAGAGSVTAASGGLHLTAVTTPTRTGWIALGSAVVVAASAVVVANALVTTHPATPTHDAAAGPGSSSAAPALPAAPDPSPAPPAAIVVPPPVAVVAPPQPSQPSQPQTLVPPPVAATPPAAVSAPPSTPPAPPVSATADGAPALTSPAEVLTRDSTTTVTGTAPVGSTIVVHRGGTSVGTATVDASGSWSWTATGLAEGETTFSFTATSPGMTPSAAVSVAVTRDSIAPAAPVITSEASATQLTPYQLAGTAEPSSVITVETATGAVLTTVTTDASGHWSTSTITGFTPAMSELLVTATDAAGNVSQVTTAGPFAFVPVFPDPSGQVFGSATVPVTLEGWPGSSVTLTLNGVTQGSPIVFPDSGTLNLKVESADASPLRVGDYTVTATYVDGTNTSAATASWAFTVAPD